MVWTGTWAVVHDQFQEGGSNQYGMGRLNGVRGLEESRRSSISFFRSVVPGKQIGLPGNGCPKVCQPLQPQPLAAIGMVLVLAAFSTSPRSFARSSEAMSRPLTTSA